MGGRTVPRQLLAQERSMLFVVDFEIGNFQEFQQSNIFFPPSPSLDGVRREGRTKAGGSDSITQSSSSLLRVRMEDLQTAANIPPPAPNRMT